MCLVVSKVQRHVATEINNVNAGVEAGRGNADELICKAEGVDECIDKNPQCRDTDWPTGLAASTRPRDIAMHITNVIDDVRIGLRG